MELQRFPQSPRDGLGPPNPPFEADHDAAFRELYNAHASALRRYAERFVRSADVAEDLVQDVFASVWRLRDRLDAGPGMRAYLYAATRARSLNHLAHERVEERGRQEFAVPDGPDSALPSAAEDALAQGELAEAVQRVLEIMPPRQREVVALRLRDQLTAAEIGARLGISPRTVEVHIARATHTLRELLPKLLGEIPRAR